MAPRVSGRVPYIYTALYEGGERTPGVRSISTVTRSRSTASRVACRNSSSRCAPAGTLHRTKAVGFRFEGTRLCAVGTEEVIVYPRVRDILLGRAVSRTVGIALAWLAAGRPPGWLAWVLLGAAAAQLLYGLTR